MGSATHPEFSGTNVAVPAGHRARRAAARLYCLCIPWVPLGLEIGCPHSGNYEDRRQGEAACLQHVSKSHRDWEVLLQIVLILTEKTDPDLAWGARVALITSVSDLSGVTSNLPYFLKL